ncbi:HK97 family phage prohead protease [Flavobacterium sp. HSC-61S13]|uniref:HK97 family phage prohead protease n=1 Tax=Flavobacterium sp. HSC-61S13 TaxID=2910963 RepID=UPI00209D6A2B|nr:HK97 family phage prohead protease [Flavobacterium sp. HSC-61S13]MCP1997293.1 HK97 family phage prohead protease [Flavobacterium sp. HSC-61S13]
MNKTFVLNDESMQNNYGFRILNSGINLDRFNRNPICLNDHRNTPKDVLGAWSNLRFEDGLLLGEVIFNTEDIDGKEVARKVNEGLIKACSLGFDFNADDLIFLDGELVLVKCELKEISIVAVPSSANTLMLYAQDGMAFTETDIKAMCLSAAQNTQIQKPNIQMKKVLLHLQLSDSAQEPEVIEAIKSLEGKLSAKAIEVNNLQATVAEFKSKETATLKANFDNELSAAQLDGRMDEAGKKAIEDLAKSGGFEKATGLLKALPKRNPIADKLFGEQATLSAFDKMSWDELDKGNKLESMKLNHPEYFVQRFKEKFNKEPNK